MNSAMKSIATIITLSSYQIKIVIFESQPFIPE